MFLTSVHRRIRRSSSRSQRLNPHSPFLLAIDFSFLLGKAQVGLSTVLPCQGLSWRSWCFFGIFCFGLRGRHSAFSLCTPSSSWPLCHECFVGSVMLQSVTRLKKLQQTTPFANTSFARSNHFKAVTRDKDRELARARDRTHEIRSTRNQFARRTKTSL